MSDNKRRSAEALALLYLRSERNWTKRKLATELGLSDDSLLSRYEKGEKLTRENLDSLVAPLEHPPEAVDALLFVHGLVAPDPAAEPASPVALTAGERAHIHRAALTAGWTVADDLRALLARRKRQEKADAARREAGELWEILKTVAPEERRELVSVFPEYRNWALALLVCDASVKAAAHRVEEARELADLALFIAERVPGDERFRFRLQGWCQAHLANARRVANDFDDADAIFARAWELWRAGEGADPELLPEWRLLDLEASLRREQHRFSEALVRLDEAREACGADALAVGRILLNKEHVYSKIEDREGALAALKEAAPFIEVTQDPHLLFAHRFNTVDNLCYLDRYGEAAELLPQVREMAIKQGNALHLTRVLWLTARVASGQGRREEAEAALEQVQQAFAARQLPYDAALAGLDLAVLWLEAGRAADVRRLAEGMKWIFVSKKIAREALAALSLFCEAARRDAATVELARQVSAEIEAARSAPRPASRRGSRG